MNRSNERGFTLLELVIVVTVMPLLVGAMSLGLITMFHLQSNVTSKTGNSADAQITASVFVKDVQSANLITALPTPICNTTGEIATQILGLQWNNGEEAVSYVSVAVTDGSTTTYSLIRQLCTAGNDSVPRSNTVSNNFPNGTVALITCVTATTSCDTSHQWLSADVVKSVTIKFAEGDKIGNSTVPFTYFLQASPRIWTSSVNGGSSGGSPYAPLILLGGTNSPDPPTGCKSGSAMTIKHGTVSINVGGGSGNGGIAISSNCPDSVDINSGGTLLAGPVTTQNTSGNPSIQATGNSTLVTGTTTTTTGLTDPLAGLVPPSSPTSPGSCTLDRTSGIYYCSPGLYSADPGFPNSSQVVFTGGGNYEFQAGLNLPGGNGSNYTFATGNYIFDSTNALTMGTSSVNVNGSNVLFYITGQNASFANNSNINLTAEDGNLGVTIWDAYAGANGSLTLGNNSSTTTNTYGGIYAPFSTVYTAQNGTVTCAFIVTNSASFVNNTVINITAP